MVAFRRAARWHELEPRWHRLAQLVHAGFGTRRKTLANAIDIAGFALRADAERALTELGLDVRVRAEALPPERFVALEALL